MAGLGTETGEKGPIPRSRTSGGCIVWEASCHSDSLGTSRLAAIPM